jgi:putative tributyrin esterase
MGGRGAITYSWAHPDKFAAAYSMSWVPQNMRQIAEELEKTGEESLSLKDRLGKERNRIRLQNAGGPQAYLASPYNTWDRAAEWTGRTDMPKTFFSCGTEDSVMYRRFEEFRSYAEEIKLNAKFTERAGYGHEWRFWDLEIQRAIEIFLPDNKES